VVSLNVKNKKTLEESLKSFVEGEMLEGDNAIMCSTCKQKARITSRLSSVLTIHTAARHEAADMFQDAASHNRLPPEAIRIQLRHAPKGTSSLSLH